MYERGLGVREDQVEAARLYKMGAEQKTNNQAEVESKAQAEVHLARMYANGWGVQLDCGEAARLMTLAANSQSLSSETARNQLKESSCPGDARGMGHRW